MAEEQLRRAPRKAQLTQPYFWKVLADGSPGTNTGEMVPLKTLYIHDCRVDNGDMYNHTSPDEPCHSHPSPPTQEHIGERNVSMWSMLGHGQTGLGLTKSLVY